MELRYVRINHAVRPDQQRWLLDPADRMASGKVRISNYILFHGSRVKPCLVLTYIAWPSANTELADEARGWKRLSYLAGIYMHLGSCPQSRGITACITPYQYLHKDIICGSSVDPRGWRTEIVPPNASSGAMRDAVHR